LIYSKGRSQMKILMFSLEDERWGAIRLVQALSERGGVVATLCPADHAMTQTRFAARQFALESVTNSRTIEAALSEAMHGFRPSLIIPGDERAVAFLHALLRRAKSGAQTRLDAESISALSASLCDSEHYSTLLMKNETIALARKIGVPTPKGGSVTSAQDAKNLATQIAAPVYVKQAFSWAGWGVVHCDNPDDAAIAYASMRPKRRNPLLTFAKRFLHRDWYPTNSAVDVQEAIDGTPALFCASAWKGKMLAGFSGRKVQTTHENGPSSVMELAPHDEMARMTAAMIAATGATGFIAFDFMIESQTGNAYLIECNPRPVPCCHLGPRIGVDLCQALIDAMRGDVRPRPAASHAETIALFPQEWRRSPEALAAFPGFVDVPVDDEALLERMTMGKAFRAQSSGAGIPSTELRVAVA
jgi:hypothetical protein